MNLLFIPFISSDTVLSRIRAYILVVLMSVCPSILATDSIETLLASATVANVCLAQWNIHGKASDSEQVKIKRKPLEISDISVFCQVEKMQTTTEY